MVPPSFYARAGSFDGTNDYLSKATDFTGNADGNEGTVFVVFRPTAGDGSVRRVFVTENDYVGALINADNSFQIYAKNGAATQIMRLHATAGTSEVADGWTIALAAWKLDTAGARHLYRGNTADTNVIAFTNDTIKYTDASHYIGATAAGLQKFTGDIAVLWVSRTYIDISIEANRRKFITNAGKPVWFGDHGELPTGSPPLVAMTGDDFTTGRNRGSGGNFTVTGSIPISSSSPSA